MPLFDECCVLVPASTLEDFPSDLSDYDARSLLAAWTVLWHPRLLADLEQTPAWYRADAPPEPIGKRLITVGTTSLSQLPDGYEARVKQNDEAQWVTGGSREEMLGLLGLESCQPLGDSARRIDERDFYAAGYAALQVQIMTRRLRYTSNLDEIHLQNRIVAAAKAFLDGSAKESIEALHDVFDCLAEERDHYFSSDPHLIDLTLTSKSTIEPLLAEVEKWTNSESDATPPKDADKPEGNKPDADKAETDQLTTPVNVLIDRDVATALSEIDRALTAPLRDLLASRRIGWVGGGPGSADCLDAMTLAEAESSFRDAYSETERAIGTKPPVYGRFAGATPSDMTATLMKLGYCGMIPIDFAGGSGFGEEAKVIVQSAGGEIEALTAKPIDAASDAAFLSLGARLGEAIDSGEIATALLAHWPGQACDAFADLKRVASWSLCLGRFWKLEEFFREGEHPYHHGTLQAVSPAASQLLESRVEAKVADPISSLASQFRQNVIDERQQRLAGMTCLVTGESTRRQERIGNETTRNDSKSGSVSDASDDADNDLAFEFAAAIGSHPAEDSETAAMLLINPHSTGARESVVLSGGPPRSAKHLFAASRQGDQTASTVDIPACGFVVVQSGSPSSTESLGKRLRQKWGGGPKPIVESGRLQNEFMEVTLSPESGGISGIYSGAGRGNRFSMRLVQCSPRAKSLPKEKASKERASKSEASKGPPSKDESPKDFVAGENTEMRCQSQRIVTSTPAVGCIETSGDLVDLNNDAKLLATYKLRYTLHRGSRLIRVDGEVLPVEPICGKPWEHYIAARAAVATESAICRTLLRDKVHRAKSRRLVAPLGIILDEAERQTLVTANGSAFHRRIGDRFLDTLLVTEGESTSNFTLHYGIDVNSPVDVARQLIAPPLQVPIEASADLSEIGWLVHASSKGVVISTLDVGRRADGSLAAVVRLIQTRPQSGKCTVRFLRDVSTAMTLSGPSDDPLNHPLPAGADASQGDKSPADSPTHDDELSDISDSNAVSATSREILKCEGDAVSLSMPSHGAIDMLVVFARDA